MRALSPWFLSLALLVVVASCGADDADDGAATTASSAVGETEGGASSTSASNPTTESDPTTEPESTSSTAAPSSTGGTTDESTSQTTSDSAAQTGIVNVGLAPVEGFFIEGFEVGLRFETAEGEVIDAMLWTDIIDALGDPSIDDYYEHVHAQPVPAGEVVVLATVSIGAGPPPVVPDLRGPMQCQLAVEVPADGEVDVEVSFDQGNCLSLR